MYRVILDGVPIECDSLEEAKRLAKSIANENQAGETGRARTASAKKRRKFDVRAAKLLNLVREAGPTGILGAKLATALGLDAAKGLGPIAAGLNRRLKAAKIDPKSVYGGGRIGKERGWFAKEKIDEALRLIEA